MATNGTDIVGQLRGRMKFYHVGDPVRVDMERACEEIGELRAREMLMQAALDEAERRRDQDLAVELIPHTPDSVREWLHEMGIKLLPWQRKRLGLGPAS